MLNEETQVDNPEENITPSEEEATTDEQTNWEAEAKKYKAIADRKSKQLEKVLIEDTPEPKKINTDSNQLTRDEAILFAKGYTPEEVELATKLSKLNQASMLEVTDDEYFKSVVDKRMAKEQSEAKSLGASNGGVVNTAKPDKPVGEMTDEEHKEYFRKRVAG